MIINISANKLTIDQINDQFKEKELEKLELSKEEINPYIYKALKFTLSKSLEELDKLPTTGHILKTLLGINSTTSEDIKQDLIEQYIITSIGLKFSVLKDKTLTDSINSVYIALAMIEDEIPLSKITKYTDLTEKELVSISNFLKKVTEEV